MLEKFAVITGVQPIGGWRYLQPLSDGTTQRLPIQGCAGTDSNLVSQVKAFRIQAGIDYGDPEADVAEFIKTVSPINNRFPQRPHQASKIQIEQARGFRPYIERIKTWLHQMSGKQPRLLIEDEADARADVCMGCPHNVKWAVGCVPCNEAIKSRGQNIRQRPRYKHDSKLGACRLHDLHISTAVFLDREALPSINPNAPQNCWLHNVA